MRKTYFIFFLILLLSPGISFADNYYIIVNQKQEGPFTPEQLKQKKNNNELTKETMVWTNGMPGWEKAGDQQELMAIFIATPPPLPVPENNLPPAIPSIPEVPNTESEKKLSPEAIDPQEIISSQEPIDLSSFQSVKNKIEQYAQEKNIKFGVENSKGQTYYYASSTISVEETNPQWPKWRVIAYKRAFSKIQNNFLESTYGNIAGEKINQYFQDDSDNKLDFPTKDDNRPNTKLAAIWEKLITLSGAKLDQALRENGIDPAKYSAAPLEQRKTLFMDNFIESSVKKAAGQLAGLMPVITFEATDSKGGHSIGVIAMYYGKLKELASSIQKNISPMLTHKSGKTISSQISDNEKLLSNTFGTRLVFDENSNPAIISYGQWSYSYNGKNDRKRARGYEYALKKAKTESQKQISEFINSNAFYQEIEETNAKEQEEAVLSRDGNISQEEIIGIVDKLRSKMNVKFNADLTGIKTAKTWSYTHPTGHEIVGVVSVWTQKNVEAANKIKNWTNNHRHKDSAKNKEIKYRSSPNVSEGAGMTLDF